MAPPRLPAPSYGFIIDAGSSGSRLFIYKWVPGVNDQIGVPKVTLAHSAKVKKGLSEYAGPNYTSKDVSEYLKILTTTALEFATNNSLSASPIFLLATGGVRGLTSQRRTQLLHRTTESLTNLLEGSGIVVKNVRAISVEEEAVFAWIAMNRADKGPTSGVLEMGGASFQIASEREGGQPNPTQVCLGGSTTPRTLAAAGWDGYGSDQARKLYVETIVTGSGVIDDPCLPEGLDVDLKPIGSSGDPRRLHGTGRFQDCLLETRTLWTKGEVFEPHIDFSAEAFIGLSNFWHSYDYFMPSKPEDPFRYALYLEKVSELCTASWDEMKDYDKWRNNLGLDSDGMAKDDQLVQTAGWREDFPEGSPQYLPSRCFNAAWVASVLGSLDGAFGSNTESQLKIVPEGHIKAPTWTLGAMSLIANRNEPNYSCPASSLSPPPLTQIGLDLDFTQHPTSSPSQATFMTASILFYAMIAIAVVALACWHRRAKHRRITLLRATSDWEIFAGGYSKESPTIYGDSDLSPSSSYSPRGVVYSIAQTFSPFSTPCQPPAPHTEISTSHHYISILADGKREASPTTM